MTVAQLGCSPWQLSVGEIERARCVREVGQLGLLFCCPVLWWSKLQDKQRKTSKIVWPALRLAKESGILGGIMDEIPSMKSPCRRNKETRRHAWSAPRKGGPYAEDCSAILRILVSFQYCIFSQLQQQLEPRVELTDVPRTGKIDWGTTTQWNSKRVVNDHF
jgi:hypothetical protein